MINEKLFQNQKTATILKGEFKGRDVDILVLYVNKTLGVVDFIIDEEGELFLYKSEFENNRNDFLGIYLMLTKSRKSVKDFAFKEFDNSSDIILKDNRVKDLIDSGFQVLSEELVNKYIKDSGITVNKSFSYKLPSMVVNVTRTLEKMTRGKSNYKLHPDIVDTSKFKGNPISPKARYIIMSTLDGKCHYTLLSSEPGTGKSTIAKIVAEEEDIPVYQMQFSNGTDEEGALCGVIPNTEDPNGTPWLRKESVLLWAMRYGGLVILDEINKAPTTLTSVLNSILDDNASYTTDTGEVIHIHKDFRIIATMNPKVENVVNDSTVNRFKVYRMPYPTDKELLDNFLCVQIPELKANKKLGEQLIKDFNKVNSELKMKGFPANTPRNVITLANDLLDVKQFTKNTKETKEIIQRAYEANLVDWLDVNYINDEADVVELYSLCTQLSGEIEKLLVESSSTESGDTDLGITVKKKVLSGDSVLDELNEIEDMLMSKNS